MFEYVVERSPLCPVRIEGSLVHGTRDSIFLEEVAVIPLIPLPCAPHNAAVGVALDGSIVANLGKILGENGALDEVFGVRHHNVLVDGDILVAQIVDEMGRIRLDVASE